MISPARSAAFRALVLFRRNNRIILPHCNEDVDRHLAERIYYGVLQNERFLDFCLAQLITRGFHRLHPAVLDLLRLSAYQVLFLDRIPDSAVVNDAVELCRKASYSHHAGLVNAVLRKLSGHRDEFMAMSPSLAVRFSHPDWMVARLTERYGEEFTEALLKANQSIPALRLQINTDLCTARQFTEYLKQNGVEIISVNNQLCSVLVGSTAVEGLPGYREGLFYIQDDAARTSVHLAGITRGMDVLDACAAPGGKSIAAKLEGGSPVSCDISADRLQRCAENYQRLKMDIPVLLRDAGVFYPEFESRFPIVIADVPCTGTGIIRKHPEIRYKTESEFLNLLEIQRSILENVYRYVSPGGLLLYSTCSVMQEENESQIESFLRDHREFHLEPVKSENDPCMNGMFHSWPHLTGNDGFFTAKLRYKHA